MFLRSRDRRNLTLTLCDLEIRKRLFRWLQDTDAVLAVLPSLQTVMHKQSDAHDPTHSAHQPPTFNASESRANDSGRVRCARLCRNIAHLSARATFTSDSSFLFSSPAHVLTTHSLRFNHPPIHPIRTRTPSPPRDSPLSNPLITPTPSRATPISSTAAEQSHSANCRDCHKSSGDCWESRAAGESNHENTIFQ